MVPSTFQQQNPGHPSSRPFQFYKNESAQSMTKAISVPLIDYPTPDIQMGLDSLLNDWSHSQTFFWEQKKNKTKTSGNETKMDKCNSQNSWPISVMKSRFTVDHCNEN